MGNRTHNSVNNGSKTKKQWAKLHRVPFQGGEWMYYNGYKQDGGYYYLFEDTREMTEKEWKAYREPLNERERKRYKKRAKEKLKNEFIRKILEIEAEKIDNPSGIICFDIETTGLDQDESDEILQFSAIDGEGNVLLNSYIKPYVKESWDRSEKINGITPETVKNAPYLHEVADKIKGIFESATVESVAYNGEFDLDFLAKFGINGHMTFDVMRHFAQIYGEWNDYFGEYKWQKLTTCAKYYKYEFKAHDSLEDVKATLFCYKKMKE